MLDIGFKWNSEIPAKSHLCPLHNIYMTFVVIHRASLTFVGLFPSWFSKILIRYFTFP